MAKNIFGLNEKEVLALIRKEVQAQEEKQERKQKDMETRLASLEAMAKRLESLEAMETRLQERQKKFQSEIVQGCAKLEKIVKTIEERFEHLEKGKLAMQIDSLLKWQDSQEHALNSQETVFRKGLSAQGELLKRSLSTQESDLRKALLGHGSYLSKKLKAQEDAVTTRLSAIEDIVQDRLSEVSQELKPIAMKSSEIAQVKLLLDSLTERLTAFEKELNVGSK